MRVRSLLNAWSAFFPKRRDSMRVAELRNPRVRAMNFACTSPFRLTRGAHLSMGTIAWDATTFFHSMGAFQNTPAMLGGTHAL